MKHFTSVSIETIGMTIGVVRKASTASPDTIILLIVDYHAAIGGPRPPCPLHTPLRRRVVRCRVMSRCCMYCSGRRRRGQQADAHVVHAPSDAGAGKRIPLQPLPVTPPAHRDRARAQPERATDQDLVPEPTHEVEEGAPRSPSPVYRVHHRMRSCSRRGSSAASAEITGYFLLRGPASVTVTLSMCISCNEYWGFTGYRGQMVNLVQGNVCNSWTQPTPL